MFGVVAMAFGIGSVVGALIAGGLVRRWGARTTAWVTIAASGVLLSVFARQVSFGPAVVILALFGMTLTMGNTATAPLLFTAVPKEFLGRAMSVFNPVNQLASMLSVVVSGWLASTVLRDLSTRLAGVHIGRIDAIFTGSALLIGLGGLYGSIALRPTRVSPPSPSVDTRPIGAAPG